MCNEAWREQTLVYPPVMCQQRFSYCTWGMNVIQGYWFERQHPHSQQFLHAQNTFSIFEYQNVTNWEHFQVFSPEHMDVFFVCSRRTKKNINILLWTMKAYRTLDECVRRSKCIPDAWNVHQVFCKCRHVLYYVFLVITAIDRILCSSLRSQNIQRRRPCAQERTLDVFPICYLGIC